MGSVNGKPQPAALRTPSMKTHLFILLLAIFLGGCGGSESANPLLPGKPPASLQSCRVADILSQHGCRDGSAGAVLDAAHFLVANDEDSVLRIYSREGSLHPLKTVDFRKFLGLKRKDAEADIEGLARIGSVIYAIASHSRSKNGKKRKERRQFFALRYSNQNGELRLIPHGQPYTKLLEALASNTVLREIDFARAAGKAGNRRDGLNIEGLASTPESGLLIGFRAPLLENDALLVPLLNPAEVVAGTAPPQFAPPKRVSLGGAGIRGIARQGKTYFLATEAARQKNAPQLFHWDGTAKHPARILVSLPKSLNPEAVLLFPNPPEIHLLSDDGNALPQTSQQRFHRVILQFPAARE